MDEVGYQEQMTVTFPGKDPVTGIVSWGRKPQAAIDAPVSRTYTAPDGTVVSYAAIDR